MNLQKDIIDIITNEIDDCKLLLTYIEEIKDKKISNTRAVDHFINNVRIETLREMEAHNENN